MKNMLPLVLVIFYLAGAGMVSGHAPLSARSNEDITSALRIDRPEKSFVIYTELPVNGEAQYYLFPMKKGQILYGSMQVPGPDSVVPAIVIIGPGIEPEGDIPAIIQVPHGSGAREVQGKPPGKPSYEPFSPQPIYEVARFNVTIPQDGSYYIAVFGPAGGKYSLAPGFLEEFTAAEWLLIPWSVVTIHLWEGQSPLAVFAPMAIVVIGGLAAFVCARRKQGLPVSPEGWMVLTAGLLYIGGAAMTALQVVHAAGLTGYSPGVLLTLLFIAGPLILGIFAARAGIRPSGPDTSLWSGLSLFVIGVLGLLLWAGLIIGPLLAFAGGVFVLVRHGAKPGAE